MENETADTVKRLYEGLQNQDIEAVVSIFDPEVEISTPESLPWSTGYYKGLDGAMAYFTGALEYLDENDFSVEEIRVSGEWAAAIGQWNGHFRDGAGFSVRFVHFWTLRNGKVINADGISDTAGILRAYQSVRVPS